MIPSDHEPHTEREKTGPQNAKERSELFETFVSAGFSTFFPQATSKEKYGICKKIPEPFSHWFRVNPYMPQHVLACLHCNGCYVICSKCACVVQWNLLNSNTQGTKRKVQLTESSGIRYTYTHSSV